MSYILPKPLKVGYTIGVIAPSGPICEQEAIYRAKKGDIVLIAGKGHENYQIVKDNIVEFDDKKVAKMIIDEMK